MNARGWIGKEMMMMMHLSNIEYLCGCIVKLDVKAFVIA